MNSNDVMVPYTPEFSNELSRKVKHVYEYDIKYYYPQLKLEKLIDLLEHTQYLFEMYLDLIHKNKVDDALSAFIIGCFYLYLIIPQSIQFQSKNKSYSIYSDMKKLYDSQSNMTNVILMVRDEIEKIQEDNSSGTLKGNSPNNDPTSLRIRALSLPVQNDVPASEIKSAVKASEVAQTNVLKPNYSIAAAMSADSTNNNRNVGTVNNNENKLSVDEPDTSEIVWTAPHLEPDDQLKLAADINSLSLAESKVMEQALSGPIAFPEENNLSSDEISTPNRTYRTRRTYTYAGEISNQFPTGPQQSFPQKDNDLSQLSKVPTSNRVSTHRRDSYHSIYMVENDNSNINYDKYYDDSNGFIQSLKRWELQSIITAPELFSSLSNPSIRSRLLLIDLRSADRYQINHIIAPNLVHIDPSLLWDSKTNTPIYDFRVLEQSLNNELFNKRNEFDYIVCYSDTRTFMNTNFDYHFALFYLLVTSIKRGSPHIPSITTLLGGIEKWRKILMGYAEQYNVNFNAYMYGPYDRYGVKCTLVGDAAPPVLVGIPERPSLEEDASSTNTNASTVPEPPPWNPPDIPQSIRSRHPPPLPGMIPEVPLENPPQFAKVPYSRPAIETPTEEKRSQHNAQHYQPPLQNWIESQVPKPIVPNTHSGKSSNLTATRSHGALVRPRNHTPKFSIPTVEMSPNIFVSLSITGLRNLGNTCYVNSMLQCLFSTWIFRDLFLSNQYETFLKKGVHNLRHQGNYYNELALSKSFNVLFTKMYMNGGCSVVPIAFLKTCNILRPDLKIPDNQQDTQEFLLLILDKLHDELSKQHEVVEKYPGLLLYDVEKLKVDAVEYKKWHDSSIIGAGVSPIDDIFQGQLENSLQCQKCGHTSYSYSSFYVLSLAIPKKAMGLTKSGLSRRVSLEECISMFTTDEILSGENAWNCPECCGNKKKQLIEKRRKILMKNDTSSSTSISTTGVGSKKSTKENLRARFRRQSSNEAVTAPISRGESDRKFKHSLFSFGRSKDKRKQTSEISLGTDNSRSNHNKDSGPYYSMPSKARSSSRLSQNPASLNGLSSTDDEELSDFDFTSSNRENDDEIIRRWKNKKLTTRKSLNFIKLPNILVVHLSRFYYDLTKKNDTVVTYPLILNIQLKNGEVERFRLYGVVNHAGNLLSGHYTALVNKDLRHRLSGGEQKWYYFDDEVVKAEGKHGNLDRGISKVSSRDAYVLFYEKIRPDLGKL